MTIIYIFIHSHNVALNVVPAAKCLGEYLLVTRSSLLYGHCPTKHFQGINSPTAFARPAHMMHKAIRTHCLNKYTITTTIAILIPSSYYFRTDFFFLSMALGSKSKVLCFWICKLGKEKWSDLPKVIQEVHQRNKDKNSKCMAKLSTEDFAELCLLCK